MISESDISDVKRTYFPREPRVNSPDVSNNLFPKAGSNPCSSRHIANNCAPDSTIFEYTNANPDVAINKFKTKANFELYKAILEGARNFSPRYLYPPSDLSNVSLKVLFSGYTQINLESVVVVTFRFLIACSCCGDTNDLVKVKYLRGFLISFPVISVSRSGSAIKLGGGGNLKGNVNGFSPLTNDM